MKKVGNIAFSDSPSLSASLDMSSKRPRSWECSRAGPLDGSLLRLQAKTRVLLQQLDQPDVVHVELVDDLGDAEPRGFVENLIGDAGRLNHNRTIVACISQRLEAGPEIRTRRNTVVEKHQIRREYAEPLDAALGRCRMFHFAAFDAAELQIGRKQQRIMVVVVQNQY